MSFKPELLFSFLFFLNSCSKKVVTECASSSIGMNPIESKVLYLRSAGITDTSVAYLSGLVSGKDSVDKKVTVGVLPFSAVSITDQLTYKSSSLNADLNGKFNTTLNAGTYMIKISQLGYQKLIIENVIFVPGEKKEMSLLLGCGKSEIRVNGLRLEEDLKK